MRELVLNKQSMQICSKLAKTAGEVLKHPWFYIMMLPGILYFILFKYLPMWGLLISFKDYQSYLGFFKSPWVGFEHYIRFFTDPWFFNTLRNTFVLAFYNIVFYFPVPIVLSLMLNEVRNKYFKRSLQTIVYIPYFISWVVVVGIAFVFLTTEGGVVNGIISQLGGEKINFLLSPSLFRPVVVFEIIWKEAGWGTVLFLAALTSIDPSLYEASHMDGANRFQQIYYITLPGIMSTIITLFILRLGRFLDTGFEQIYLMLNGMNREVGEVFDTYAYVIGIQQGQFSYSTAIGLFKSIIGLVLIVVSNKIINKMGHEGIY